jgi:hypothetical protein
MPQAEFKPAMPVTKLPQTYVLDRAATGIGIVVNARYNFPVICYEVPTAESGT